MQEEDVENDEKKKNENKQCEISATKDKPIQKELHEADTTKNKEFAKKVDDFEDGRWPKNNLRIIYLTHMKTRSYDCSTYVGSSCIVNEGACRKCTRTSNDDHCTTTILFKDERETKERDRRIVDI